MSPTRYIVLEHEGQWKINLNNVYFGPFATREEAVRDAIETAQKAGEQGHNALVMVMAGPTLFDTVWEYGKDAVPQ